MPRVSICIPSYKPGHFEICLASAVAQTFQDIEIIVSDDCPTDAIERICEKFPGRVQYSRNPNPGSKRNMLRLIELAKGEYIKFLLDDDLLHPFCVQYLVEALEATRAQNTTLAFSPRDLIDQNNGFLSHVNMLKIAGSVRVINGRECIQVMAANARNVIGELTTVMFRRADAILPSGSLLDFGDFTSRGLGDVIAWINLAAKGNVVAHPVTLSYFRQHQGSNSDPAANPEFIYSITEWEVIVDYVTRAGWLSADQLPLTYNSLLREYRYWAPRFPQLQNDILRFERHLTEIAA